MFYELKTYGKCFCKVTNKKGEYLGTIEPDSAWKDYTFIPQPNTRFSITGLTEIVKKMKKLVK